MRRFVRLATMAVISFLCFAWLCSGTDAMAEGRKLTIMVYMCGSNLESAGGSATEDIQEMLASVPEGRDIALLVMTGGSDVQAQGSYFHTDNAGVYEIASGGRIRRLPDSPQGANMGDGETLASFLRYCREKRPADRYALILWDHGGGPLEGVCWDENNGTDHLTMDELTGALRDGLTEKLEWIGFDACLMGSLEVAGAMAPYANYMIASQEMEPPFGWNYGFLAKLDPAAGGADAGRQIVDAFFDGQEETNEILTLACIDLSKTDEAIAALDPVFLPMSRTLDDEQYMAVSARRMKTTGFGKAQPDTSTSGYDLVDIRDMVESLEPTEETGQLLEKLDSAIVYSRANEDGANGLTVYYPFENKTRYSAEWRERYAAYPFSTGYQAYVEAFGRILIGEKLMVWRNLVPTAGEQDADGFYPFELQLTPEQARNVVSAQIMIIGDTFTNQLGYDCILLGTCSAEPGGDNVLRGKWDGRCLYVETENGITGPISFRQTDDGQKNLITLLYVLEGNTSLKGTTVHLELNADDPAEYPEINRILIWDDVTESFSSRNKFSEDGYDRIAFWNLRKTMPNIGDDLVLPPMDEWAQEHTGYSIPTITLPQNWKLRMIPQYSGRQMYAIFRLVDSQHQVICSVPVAIPNPYRTTYTPVSGTIDTGDLQAELACTLDTSPDRKGFHLEWAFHNNREQKIKVYIKDLFINETRMIDSSSVTAYEGYTSYRDMHLSYYDLAGLDQLESVTGRLELEVEGEETRRVPFRFTFSGADLSAAAIPEPLARTEQDGVTMTLLGIEPGSFSRMSTYVLIQNDSGEELDLRSVALNHLEHASYSDPIPSGADRVVMMEADNECSSISLKIKGGDEAGEVTYLEYYLLQAMGYREINEVSVGATVGEEKQLFSMALETPWKLAEVTRIVNKGMTYPVWNPPDDLPFPQEDRLPVLAENDEICIRLRRAVAGLNGIALSVEIENRSEYWINMNSKNCTVNGQPAEVHFTSAGLFPHQTKVKDITINGFTLPEGETMIREIELDFYDWECFYSSDAVSATIVPETPIPLGKEGGYWINGESFTTVPARLPDRPKEEETGEPAEADPTSLILREVAVPENASSYSVTVDSGLLPEEAAGATDLKAAVVRKTAEGWLQVLTIQNLEAEKDGRIVLHHPGLILTVEEDPSIAVMSNITVGKDGRIDGTARQGAVIWTESWETVNVKSFRWSLDPETNTAMILSFEQDSYPQKPVYLSSTSFLTYEILPETKADGTLPHIAGMKPRDDFEWYLNAPGVMANHPVRLTLRPVTPEDELYVMFSVTLGDGTRCSLPLVPYPAE